MDPEKIAIFLFGAVFGGGMVALVLAFMQVMAIGGMDDVRAIWDKLVGLWTWRTKT